MQVHLTYDVEVWCGGWSDLRGAFPAAFRRYVYGPKPKETGALPTNLKILKENGLRAVFFVEPLFSFYFGLEPLEEIVQLIISNHQDVQLHLHPEWLDELDHPLVAPRQKTPYLHSFNLNDQITLVGSAADRLVEAGASRPTAFRSGNYSINIDSLKALRANGFCVDSSINSSYPYPYPKDNPSSLFQPSQIEGVIEYPVTNFQDGFGRQRPMQISACSTSELTQALGSARDNGLTAATIVSHNFELLTADRMREDRIAVRRFDKFCAWLARHDDEFKTGVFNPKSLNSTVTWSWPSASRQATAIRHVEQLARRTL